MINVYFNQYLSWYTKDNSLLKTSYSFCSASLILQKTLQMYEIERGFKGQGQM